MNPPLVAQWLGRMPFAECLELQQRAREEVVSGRGPEILFLVEHPATLGTRTYGVSKMKSLRAIRGHLRLLRAVRSHRL